MIAQRWGNVSFRWRRVARLLILVTSLGAAMVAVAPPALAFHESVANAEVRTSACGGVGEDVIAAQDVKSFNETATTTEGAMDARASQNTGVSSSSTLSATTSGEMNVTLSEPGGCGTAASSVSVFPDEDDDEFSGDYFFTVSGSMSFEDESDDGSPAEDGCIQFSVGGVLGESKCGIDEDESIVVNGSGFAEFPVLHVLASVGVSSSEATSATARWNLTLTVFPPDVCPASEPAGAGFSAATAECPTPTVGFANDEGLDGGITEADQVTFIVTLTPAQTTDVVVNFVVGQAIDQEALAGQDFTFKEGQLTFPPGATLLTIEVPLIADTIAEPDEAFVANLTLPAGGSAVTLGKDRAAAIIRDDDCAVHVPSASAPNDFTVPAGTGGATCGSIHADVIRGTNAGDTILGGAGSDVLTGRAGQDGLNGGIGNDKLFGGFGVEAESDPSRDFLTGGPEEPRATADDDEIFGEAGNDVIDGGAGDDRLEGGEGNDDIAGGVGVESLIKGGPGDDILYAAFRPSLAALANTATYITEDTDEALLGEAGNDTLHGSDGDNLMFGGPGNDTIYGHGGRDRLNGEAGNDSLREGPLFSLDIVKDFLFGGLGAFDSCIATPVIDDKFGCEL